MKEAARHVRTVVALLRASVDPATVDPETLHGVSWHDVIAFASAHFVVQALAPGLRSAGLREAAPADAVGFLDALAEANATRNARLRDELHAICAALDVDGVPAVALKGAAFLAADYTDTPAPWRFMQDLDLLVPEDRLGRAVGLLVARGFAPCTETYDPFSEAHYPPLASPCRTFTIEVHTRLFAHRDYGLPAEIVLADARPVGEALRVPSNAHRLMHLIAHAQLHNRNCARRRLVLKDMLDLAHLARQGLDVEAAALLFVDPASRDGAEALLAAWGGLLGTRPDDGDEVARPAHRWARSAIARLSWPRWRKGLALPLDLARLERYRLAEEPGHLGRRARLAVSRERLSRAAAAFAFKERQHQWR